MNKFSFFLGGLLIFLLAACGPSPEQVATMTASAWTPTPKPTATPIPTFTPTPVPYDLTVSVVDETGAPIAGASITFPEAGEAGVVTLDSAGKSTWTNLPGADVTLDVTAQGYLPANQTASLERGSSNISLVMKRDPYGLLPSTACAPGEELLYMEDFQNGSSILAHNNSGGAAVPLGPAADETGNMVVVHDFTTPVGDFSTFLKQNNGAFYEFGDAVWRFRFMETQETNWALNWNSARASNLGEIITSESSYGIMLNANRHVVVLKSVWDSSGQPVTDLEQRFLADKLLFITPNVWHYMEVSTYQGRLQIWLEGENLVDVVDNMPLPAGGFEIGAGSGGMMYFDTISVCGLSAPFTSIMAPVPVP